MPEKNACGVSHLQGRPGSYQLRAVGASIQAGEDRSIADSPEADAALDIAPHAPVNSDLRQIE